MSKYIDMITKANKILTVTNEELKEQNEKLLLRNQELLKENYKLKQEVEQWKSVRCKNNHMCRMFSDVFRCF
jgi:FtsZ-binding cell division protein ZapB